MKLLAIVRKRYLSVHEIKTPAQFFCLPHATGITSWIQSRLQVGKPFIPTALANFSSAHHTVNQGR